MTQTKIQTAKMKLTETIITTGNDDCLGNTGTLKTTTDFYVRDIYEATNAQWWQESTGKRGQLYFDGNRAEFIPANRDNWVPACGGTEKPSRPSTDPKN